MKLFSASAFSVLVLGTAACQNPAAPSSTIIDDNLIRLTATASASDVVPGTPVTLRITLTNEGTRSVTLHFNSGCQILPYIRDARGANVIPDGGGYGCTAALTQLTLAPGHSEIREYKWTGSNAFQSEMLLRPMPPGRYYFTAEVEANEAKLSTEPIELRLK